MTIKEIAELSARTERTVRRWINKACITSDEMSVKMSDAMKINIAADFTLEETENILRVSTVPKVVVDVLMQNARREVEQSPAAVDYEVIGKMIGMAVQAAMMPVVKQLENINRPQIAAPDEDYYSLLAYTNIKQIKLNRSELAVHGRALRKMSQEKNLSIHKIPDERYGQVNSYPVVILNEYFEV